MNIEWEHLFRTFPTQFRRKHDLCWLQKRTKQTERDSAISRYFIHFLTTWSKSRTS